MKQRERVLLVDDSRDSLTTYKEALEVINIYVDTAQSRDEALQKIKDSNYDLVLVDLEMPNEWNDSITATGLNLISELKHLHSDWLIVVLSSYSDRAFIAEAYKVGAKQYIVKGKSSLNEFQQEILDLLSLDTPPIIDYDLELKRRERKRIERRLRNIQDQLDILDEREQNLNLALAYETDVDKIFSLKAKLTQYQELIKGREQEMEAYKALLGIED